LSQKNKLKINPFSMKTQLIQPVKTRRQIAEEYTIHERTLRRWLQEAKLPLRQGRLLTTSDQEVIYQHFGRPFQAEERPGR
jgi:hypothetical protein